MVSIKSFSEKIISPLVNSINGTGIKGRRVVYDMPRLVNSFVIDTLQLEDIQYIFNGVVKYLRPMVANAELDTLHDGVINLILGNPKIGFWVATISVTIYFNKEVDKRTQNITGTIYISWVISYNQKRFKQTRNVYRMAIDDAHNPDFSELMPIIKIISRDLHKAVQAMYN